jgi:hypothetical protein
VATFNSLPTGLSTNVSTPFGSITGTYDHVFIRTPDDLGGANASNYPTASAAQGGLSYTLTLSGPVNHFGLFWSAGDAANRLDFYLGATLVGTFTTSTALGVLPPAYNGNPNNGGDPTEAFAYLNFFGTGGTTFDRVVFTVTDPCCGFESDNHAITPSATPTGGLLISAVQSPAVVPVLPVSVLIALAIAIGLLGVWSLRFRPASLSRADGNSRGGLG